MDGNIKITSESLAESKELRDQVIGRIDVLDKVKKLFLIPGLNMMTTKQVADFYEVDQYAIRKTYARNADELNSDGVSKIKASEALGHFVTPYSFVGNGYEVDLGEGYKVVISTANTVYFPKRAVLRVGMLLRDSPIAKEVRNQLLNVYEQSSDEQKVVDIDAEKKLLTDVGMALYSGDWEQYQKATINLMDFKNRHIKMVEEEKEKLQKEKDEADRANALLAREVTKVSDPRRLITFLTNVYAKVRWPGVHPSKRMPRAYFDLYRTMLNSSPHIDLMVRKARRYADTIIECIDEEEYGYAISVLMGLILYYTGGTIPEEIKPELDTINKMVDKAKSEGCVVNV